MNNISLHSISLNSSLFRGIESCGSMFECGRPSEHIKISGDMEG